MNARKGRGCGVLVFGLVGDCVLCGSFRFC